MVTDVAFEGLLGKICGLIMDDIVFSNIKEEHLEHLRLIFERMTKAHLKVKPFKCHLFQREVNYHAFDQAHQL